MGQMKKVRKSQVNEIVELDVEYISLVERPANGFGLVVKSADGDKLEKRNVPILKADDATKTLYGIVYAPDKVDTQGEFAKAEVIKSAAYKFMEQLRLKNVDTQHDFQANGSHVVESWIVRKGDELFPEHPGAWAVGMQVTDDAIWTAYKSGKITGLSLAGQERLVPAQKDAGADVNIHIYGVLDELKNGILNFFKGAEQMEQNTDKNAKGQKGDDGKEGTEGGDKAALEKLTTMLESFGAELKKLSERLDGVEKSANGRSSAGYTDGEGKGKPAYKSILGGTK